MTAVDPEFAAFVRANERSLLRLAWLLMADRDAAEDLVQTALEKTMPKWTSIRQDDPMAYVHRVMVNTRTSWWRRHRGRESVVAEVADVGVDEGFVRKAGAWYTYEGDQLGQGKENSRTFLKDNPDLADEIEKKIKEKLGIGPRVDVPIDLTAPVPIDLTAPVPIDLSPVPIDL